MENLIYLWILMIITKSNQDALTVQNLPPSGVYLLKQPPLLLQTSSYEIILYKNINLIKDKYQNLRKLLTKYSTLEDNYKNIHELVQMATLQTYITKIRGNLDLLESLTVDRRVKRGRINIIGNALHTVFGIMDSSDEEYYNEIITQLQNQNKDTLSLMKQNAHISKAVMANLNSTLSNIKRFEGSISDNINKLAKALNDVVSKQNEIKIAQLLLKFHNEFLDYAILLLNELNLIIDTVTFAQLNQLYLPILPSNILLKELKSIRNKNKLPSSLIPHFTLFDYYKLLKPVVKISKNLITISVELPLVESSVFQVYRFLTYPVGNPNHAGLYHILNLDNNYIAENGDRFITTSLWTDCYKLPEVTICSNLETKPRTAQDCEIQLLQKQNNNSCHTSTITLKGIQSFHLNDNNWLLSISGPTPIINKCPGQALSRKTVTSPCILHLEPGCVAYLEDGTIIKAQGKNTTNITLDLDLPNIQVDCCLEEITKMKEIELEPISISSLHLHDTETLSEELEMFEKKTEELYNTRLRTIKNNW